MDLRWVLFRILAWWISIMVWTQPTAAAVKKSTILKRLFKNYDSRIAPGFERGESTINSVEVFLLSFDSISESTMDYSVTMFLRQSWNDPRLKLEGLINDTSISLDARMIENLWVPDLYFYNEKKSHFHDVTVPNKLIRIYQNGDVLYSTRVTLTLSCPMMLHKFPLDSQICTMQLESYAYTTDSVSFKWTDDRPIKFKEGLELPQYSLKGWNNESCTAMLTTGTFTCLRADFWLARDIGFYIIQTYVPSILVVVLSWVSFWISVDAVPARISLGVLTILTMTTQSAGARQTLPRVSYVKAIDIWMSTCLMFVFGGLVEFAVVNVISRKETKVIQSPGEKTDTSSSYVRDPDGKEKAGLVDKFSRYGFPLVFLIFNIVYWVFYILWDFDNVDTNLFKEPW